MQILLFLGPIKPTNLKRAGENSKKRKEIFALAFSSKHILLLPVLLQND